jgi:membrane protein insertase Oxa1/YidC/SpoIIIJ
MAMEAAQSDLQIKIGKMIFYITCAVSIWFFYWFNGINCPC